VPAPSETDWAYAAGFVDGEGCIAVVRSFVQSRQRYSYGVHVVVANTDRTVLDWMQTLWGGWVVSVTSPGRGSGARPSWTWRAPTGTSAEYFLSGIRPYLRLETRQCENAMDMIGLLRRSRYTLGPRQLPAVWLADQEKLYWTQRELNHRGNRAYMAKPMHSPRKIHRERSAATVVDPVPN
jgi:hypothetical protein